MSWYVAASLNKLLAEINARFPGRDKTSDGSIGDTSHAARPSDHNPAKDSRPPGCVRARDFDNDTRVEQSMHAFMRDVPIKARDGRVKYIISDGKIISYYPVGGYEAWAERPYNGSNPHKAHAHLSIRSGDAYEDDTSSWVGALQQGGFVVDAESKKQIEDMLAPIRADVGDCQARLALLMESAGRPYVDGITLQKALIKGVKDPQTGQWTYYEHLDVIGDKLDELSATVGELADAVNRHVEAPHE